ncbi:MAG: DUF4347 domain-containing protein, partial [Methylovulum sp.]|nr:DUF4347 domain-containing protein [Methylovulum sp.]
MSSTQQNNELIFIDPSVLQYEDLIPNLAPTLPVTYVSALGNNLQSLANTLVNHQAIAVLHLVVDSSNPLGVLGLTSSTLHEYSATLQQIKAHFAPNAEIALYSNQLTNNAALTSLITQLSDALGVTISLPSVTSLGVSLAGDWDTQTHQLDSVLPYQVTDKLTAKQAKSSGAAAVTTTASYTIPNSSSTQLTFTSTTTTTLATTGLTTSTTTSTSSSTDDYPNDDVSTSGIVVLGKSSKGEIEFANDTDWFSVTLEASKVYSFNLTGSATTETTALSIPKLLLNDATGSLLNTGTVASGTASITKFTAPSAGKYYLVASASDTTATGSYSLSALEVINAKPTGAVAIDLKLPKQGQLLTASNTLADTDGLGTITYVWFAGENQVGSGSTYTTQQADVNKSITVTAQYTDKTGKAEAVSSPATRTVSNVNDLPTGAVTISTTAPKLGDTLTVSNTLADVDGLGTITYTWKAGTTTLATGNTYTVTSATINKALTVTASYTDGFNKAESVSSAATQVVTSTNNAPTGAVTVSNLSPKQGDTLTASSTLADKDGMGEISYSWQANGSAVSNGAQFSKTYTVTQNDVGKQITFIAAYKDSLGNNEAVISAATKAVANVNDAPTGTVTIDNLTPKLGDTLTVSDTLADVDGLGAI